MVGSSRGDGGRGGVVKRSKTVLRDISRSSTCLRADASRQTGNFAVREKGFAQFLQSFSIAVRYQLFWVTA